MGRCLCGEITYRVTGDLRQVLDCHCHRCRRFTGHYLAATAADIDDLVIADPNEHLRWFNPVPEAGYAFCNQCGSSLFWRSTQTPTRISICAGTLDPPTHLRTTGAIWVDQASDYHLRPTLPEQPRGSA